MKFAHKLSLAVILLLAVALSTVGTVTLLANFDSSLASITRQNAEQHLVERFSMENELLSVRGGLQDISKDDMRRYGEEITGYVGSSTRWLGLYDQYGKEGFGNMPEALRESIDLDVLTNEEWGYTLRTVDGMRVMMIASTIDTSGGAKMYMLSMYDVSSVFLERDRQVRQLVTINAIVLVLAAIVVVGLSRGLTRPLRRLNLASRKIASGAYDTRSPVRTHDEVGELAGNFNKMAAAVETHMEQLNLSVRQREDFVSAFTHEVKTPMTAIIGYSDILRSQENDAETQQRAAQFIYRESKRLESLSQKLLVLMGLSGRQAEILPHSLATLFADAARSLLPALGDCELAIRQSEGVVVLADKDLVVDMIRNLALNALKAQPKDKLVRIGWRETEGGVCVEVSDKGCGIPPEELERITEPFYMVDKSRARREGGSGVGLALAQRIAQLHDTELQFASAVGEGTTVGFVLQRC